MAVPCVVARVCAAVLALITPRLAAAGPRVLFAVLTVLIAIGMAAAIFGFRKGTRNEFDIEDQEVDETGYVQPTLAELVRVRGLNSVYFNNATQSWKVAADGSVTSL